MGYTFNEVFTDELNEIKIRRNELSIPDSGLVEPSTSLDLRGVSLSGGGIRSAAFCLGATQAFHENGILERFDYISTVSGGGYTGGCLNSLATHPSAEGRRAQLKSGFWFPFIWLGGENENTNSCGKRPFI